jgi:3'-phosphoadenosine 5'-phosphosulfate sulfotransferase (PAPS reductase)/FAD synthetase
VGRVAIVQQRVGPYKFHIRCKLQDKQSTERQQEARCCDSNKKHSMQQTSRKEE